MNGSAAGFQLFNPETMSGVFPGARTQVYQRVRLTPIDGAAEGACWALFLWYDDPSSCVIYRQNNANGQLDNLPLAQLSLSTGETLTRRLQEALNVAGWQMETCGACIHWRASISQESDQFPKGRCTLLPDNHEAPPAVLAAQSFLALRCESWRPTVEEIAPAEEIVVRPLPRAAQLSDSKKRGWERVRMFIQRWFVPKRAGDVPLAERLIERSGVGAGTEPCFVCQGRIANLTALAVESDEGDKETFSVWRCRSCFTLYLSDWVDRWERLDSLETEESIYRLAPVEALAILQRFDSVVGGDHPGRRRDRNEIRAWIKGQIAGRTPVSHIVKQGR